ncbi:hypothetical protein [Nitrosomonas sp. GH22]|nr:hypothetical protein [Nitrosomonas sp. GH22]
MSFTKFSSTTMRCCVRDTDLKVFQARYCHAVSLSINKHDRQSLTGESNG